jgi:hypothetical protein
LSPAANAGSEQNMQNVDSSTNTCQVLCYRVSEYAGSESGGTVTTHTRDMPRGEDSNECGTSVREAGLGHARRLR